jgi:hypothetical protein
MERRSVGKRDVSYSEVGVPLSQEKRKIRASVKKP